MEDFMTGFQWLVDFLSGDGEVSFFEMVTAQVVIWWIKIKIYAAQAAWDISSVVINQLGISAALNSAWASIDSTIMSYMTFFKIPDAINVLISARVTRMILVFMRVV